MRNEFYRKALPSQGVYCVAGIDKNKKVVHEFRESLDDAFAAIDELQKNEYNVFIALNTFSGYSRKSDLAVACKTFFIDLDVDANNPKKYATKEAALAELDDFVKLNDLPPPVRVDSGNGIHAYWILDRDVPTDEWRKYASKFKQFCLDHIKIDPAVTADAARILRCPESYHLKGEPKLVKFLDTDFTEYDFDTFKEFLGPVEDSVSAILADVPKGLDDETKKLLKTNNYESLFQEIAEKSLNDRGCGQIKEILLTSVSLEEPLWYAGLSIARHCTDWEEAIHLMSEDHPGYSREATINKANHALNKPFSCVKFAELNPKGCEGCEHRGRITNPLALSRNLKEATTDIEESEIVAALAANPAQITPYPAYLKPFIRGRDGGVYYMPAAEVDEDGNRIQPDPMLLCVNDFYPIKRKYSPTDGEIYVVRVVMPHETREFDLPMEIFNSTDSFKKIMSKMGITPQFQKQWSLLTDYMNKWAHYLQAQDAAEQVRGQMGWSETNDAFVLGGVEIRRDGTERRSATSPLVRNVAKFFEPRGSYEVWQKCANMLNLPGFEMHAFAMGMGFGSPLMRFCSTHGMTYCFTGNTGGAKSGAMYGAISIYANPTDVSVFKATDNAFVMRALNLKNVILGIDEVKDKDPKELSNLMHSIAQGKGKLRMKTSVTAEREQELAAALISLWTSNESMVDKLFATKKNPTGEMARYMEYRINRPKLLEDQPEMGEIIFNPFNFNYGWAGREYIKYLMKVGDEYIIAKIKYWDQRIKASRFGNDVTYRFFYNGTASSFAGLDLANEAGIVQYDIERIFNNVILHSIMVRDKTIKDHAVDYEAILTEFMLTYHNGILIFNEGRSTSQIYGPLVGRIELDAGKQYVSKSAFKKFLIEECKVSTAEMEEVLIQKGVLNKDEKKMRLGTGWKGGGDYGAIAVYVFNSTLPQDFIEKFTSEENRPPIITATAAPTSTPAV